MSNLVRVLIADDSALIRRVVSQTLNLITGIEVVGTAEDGADAIACFKAQQPDIVLLDVDMPKVSGAQALANLRELNAVVPVIMFGAVFAVEGRALLNSAFPGATDCVLKPSGVGHLDTFVEYIRAEIGPRLRKLGEHYRSRRPKAASTVNGTRSAQSNTAGTASATYPSAATTLAAPHSDPSAAEIASPRGTSSAPAGNRIRKPPAVVAIGCSTGGPNAITDLFRQLPPNPAVPILIVQHMPPMFTALLAERIGRITSISVREAYDGAIIHPGEAWIAPGDFHMVVARKGADVILNLHQQAAENSCRPAVDVLFRSVAQVYGANCLAVVLTGMGRDGTAGCRDLKKCGAEVLVQDESSSVVWGMPRSVTEAGLADEIVSLGDMGASISRRIQATCAQPDAVLAAR